MSFRLFFEYARIVIFMGRNLWFPIITLILGIIAFLFVPQGPDVLVCTLEDAKKNQPGTLIGMGIGIIFWSIALEFVSRYIIYHSDNSSKVISPEIVERRKMVQRNIPKFFLYSPSVLGLLAFIRVWKLAIFDWHSNLPLLPMGFAIGFHIFIFFLLYFLYERNGIIWISQRLQMPWLVLNNEESQWTQKLYGIHSDYRIDLTLPFPPGITVRDRDLPRNTQFPGGGLVPSEFLPSVNNPYTLPNGTYTWMFKIPDTFLPNLGKQLMVFTILSSILIAFACLLPVLGYIYIGTPVVLFVALGCWLVIYLFVYYLDKKYKSIPFRLLLFSWLLICSYINHDHPAKIVKNANSLPPRPTLSQHFEKWKTGFEQHLATCQVTANKDNPPVFLISAEGGALRTGAFVGITLDTIQDKFKCFYQHVYCISSVSGGTLGANFFHAQLTDKKNMPADHSFTSEARDFFSKDYLAPIIGRMLFGEILNYFIPWHVEKFDRAIGLEKSWEKGWGQLRKSLPDSCNALKKPLGFIDTSGGPLILINTMEVETGLPCLYSNVDIVGLPLGNKRDIIRKSGKILPYSTAISLSARFPFFSPGGALPLAGQSAERHYVDGGYFENKGVETLFQVLDQFNHNERYKFYLLQFGFDNIVAEPNEVHFLSEPAEVLTGLVKARAGRSAIAKEYIKEELNTFKIKGKVIDLPLPLSEKNFPMDWILSDLAMDRLNAHVDTLMKKVNGNNIESLERL